jgi:hypothetical protein
MKMDIDRSIDESLNPQVEGTDPVKTELRLNDEPSGRLGVIVNLVRMAGDRLGSVGFTLKDVEMIARAAYVLGYGEAGTTLSEKMRDEAVNLSGSVNEYYTKFAAQPICDLAGITIDTMAKLMSKASKEKTDGE